MAEEGAVDQKHDNKQGKVDGQAWHRMADRLEFVYQRVEKLKVRTGQSIKWLADTVAMSKCQSWLAVS